MPLAGVHAVLAILALAAIRKFLKIEFSNKLIIFGGVLGLLPDLDIPLALAINWVFGTNFYFHKIYANALVIPLMLYLAAVVLKFSSYTKAATATLAVSIAYFLHILLDCFFSIGLTANILPGGEMLSVCRNIASKETTIILDAIFIGAFLLYAARLRVFV